MQWRIIVKALLTVVSFIDPHLFLSFRYSPNDYSKCEKFRYVHTSRDLEFALFKVCTFFNNQF